jgi:uncharacterized protein YjbI with pentapeptide repeats
MKPNKKERIKRVFCQEVTRESSWIHVSRLGRFYAFVPEVAEVDGGKLITGDTIDEIERKVIAEMRDFFSLTFKTVIRVVYPKRFRTAGGITDTVLFKSDEDGSDVIGPLKVDIIEVAQRLDGKEVRHILDAAHLDSPTLRITARQLGAKPDDAIDLPYDPETHKALRRFQEIIRSTDLQIRSLLRVAAINPAILNGSPMEITAATPAEASHQIGRVNLSGSNMAKANLSGSDLFAEDLSGANLSRANLSRAYLVETLLAGSDLRWARLDEANLHRANLVGARLNGASLSRASLVGANLESVDLRKANMTGADLSNAVLLHAEMDGADLRGATLTGAVLTSASMIDAIYDDTTIADHGQIIDLGAKYQTGQRPEGA